jgi:hypothetical protein
VSGSSVVVVLSSDDGLVRAYKEMGSVKRVCVELHFLPCKMWE